jgi:N-acetyl-anhydromuramyl-L-alanine amidase AmpD
MPLDVTKINQEELTPNQYFKEDCSAVKKQILLHFTAGAPSAANTIHGWQFNPERVGTAFVISRGSKTEKDGEIFQAFGSKYWAYHIAFSKNTNKVPSKYHNFTLETQRAKESVAVEICNWGCLIKDKDGNFKNYVNGIVPANEVVTLDKPHRGYLYYQDLTDSQIASLKELVIYLCDKYKISKKYNADMWDICTRALDGENGIFSHVSYRSDKFDLAPLPKVIKMLQEIEQGI